MTPHSHVRSGRTAAAAACALFVAGCVTMPTVLSNLDALAPTSAGRPTQGAEGAPPEAVATRFAPGSAAKNVAGAADARPPAADAGAPAAARPLAPPLAVSADEVKAMIIRSDPKACSATSDATLSEVFATYAKIGLAFGSKLAVSKLTKDAELQKSLDEFKPLLRELSRNTTWMPVAAERLIGDQIYSYNKLEPYVPPARLKPLLDEIIQPMFAELQRYAAEELKSPLKFELRVVKLDSAKAPSVMAGGLVLIPSGMLSAMRSMPERDSVIAFMMAHEFSHALRRHTTKMAQLSLVDSMTIASEYKKIANTAGNSWSSVKDLGQMFSFTTENARSLVQLTCGSRDWFSTMEQNQEYEADVCASMLLKRLGDRAGKPYSAVDGYSRYLKAGLSVTAEAKDDGMCVVRGTHPDPEERLQNLKAYATAGGADH